MATEEDKRLGGDAGKSVTDTLREQFAGNDDILSSEAPDVDAATEDIISELEAGRESAKTGIEAKFERGRISTKKAGEQTLTRGRETARGLGPASQFALIDRIEKSTDESLRDLDLREQEALATGNAAVSSQIAQLKLQQLQFKVQNRQQIYSNLLSIAGLEQQERQVGIAERQQDQQERTAIANIALQFGLQVNENDTLDTIVQRAQPFASEQQKVELDAKRADIDRTKADTERILREGRGLTDELVGIFAEASVDNIDVLNSLKDPTEIAKVLQKRQELKAPRKWSAGEIKTNVEEDVAAGKSPGAILAAIDDDTTIANKEDAKRIARFLLGTDKVHPFSREALVDVDESKGLLGDLQKLNQKIEEGTKSDVAGISGFYQRLNKSIEEGVRSDISSLKSFYEQQNDEVREGIESDVRAIFTTLDQIDELSGANSLKNFLKSLIR